MTDFGPSTGRLRPLILSLSKDLNLSKYLSLSKDPDQQTPSSPPATLNPLLNKNQSMCTYHDYEQTDAGIPDAGNAEVKLNAALNGPMNST